MVYVLFNDRALRRLSDAQVNRAMRAAFRAVALRLFDRLQEERKRIEAKELRPKSVNTSRKKAYTKNWKERWKLEGDVFELRFRNEARHAYFVEKGRGPGKPPPWIPIYQYLLLHGDLNGLDEEEQADFVQNVRMKIALYGTKGHNILKQMRAAFPKRRTVQYVKDDFRREFVRRINSGR